MPFDVIVPEQLAHGRDIQRAVAYRDPVGQIEAAGDQHHSIGLVVAVTIDDRVHLAGPERSDEDGPLRTKRHLSGVLDAVGEHRDLESRGEHPLRLLGQACRDHKDLRDHDLPLSRW